MSRKTLLALACATIAMLPTTSANAAPTSPSAQAVAPTAPQAAVASLWCDAFPKWPSCKRKALNPLDAPVALPSTPTTLSTHP